MSAGFTKGYDQLCSIFLFKFLKTSSYLYSEKKIDITYLI